MTTANLFCNKISNVNGYAVQVSFFQQELFHFDMFAVHYTESSKKMDRIWNRYNLKRTGRIYTFGVLKYSEKFKVLDLP